MWTASEEAAISDQGWLPRSDSASIHQQSILLAAGRISSLNAEGENLVAHYSIHNTIVHFFCRVLHFVKTLQFLKLISSVHIWFASSVFHLQTVLLKYSRTCLMVHLYKGFSRNEPKRYFYISVLNCFENSWTKFDSNSNSDPQSPNIWYCQTSKNFLTYRA